MRLYKKVYYSLSLACLLVTGVAAPAQAKDVTSPYLSIPLHESILGVRGPAEGNARLQVTVYLPDGNGPFPVAVINAGADHVSDTHPGERLGYTFLTGYFLSRGYAVAQPMPQGFGGSSGKPISNGCALDQTGLLNAQDIKAVLHNMSAIVELDMSRIIVAGQSFGGWTSLALSTQQIPGQKGQIVFSPAFQASSCQQGDAALIQGSEKLGVASHQMPTLWVESHTDSLVPEATWRQMQVAYQKGNAHVSVLDVPVIKKDSGTLTGSPKNFSPWMPKMDTFLQRLGLPAQNVQPGYLPSISNAPPATHFAKIDDLEALPTQDDKAIAQYKIFLKKPFPRAFVIGDNAASSESGGLDPRVGALKRCAQMSRNCQLYAYNDKVVWKGPLHGQVAVHSIVMTHQQTVGVFQVSLDQSCKEQFVPQVKIVRPPQHGSIGIVPDTKGIPSYQPPSPLARCTQPVHGSLVQYRPFSTYTGQDSFVFEEQANRDNTRHSTTVMNISIH